MRAKPEPAGAPWVIDSANCALTLSTWLASTLGLMGAARWRWAGKGSEGFGPACKTLCKAMACRKLSQSPSWRPTSSVAWTASIMAFSVKNRTKGELLKWARGKGRVMEGYLDLEKPSVKALG